MGKKVPKSASGSKRGRVVSFSIKKPWKEAIQRKVDAGEYDTFSAYMRALVRRDLGFEDNGQDESPPLDRQ